MGGQPLRLYNNIMATGNPLLGTLRRSVGDVTFYRRNGEQVSRARIRKIANPRSDAQTISRLALSTATKTAQHLRNLVNHSFQGIKYGQTSVNHFTSMLAKEVRSYMESALAAGSSAAPYGTAPILPYTAGGVACGAKMLISSGDLPGMPYELMPSSPWGLLVGNNGIVGDLSDAFSFGDFESIFGVPSSTQITIVVGAPVELDYISEVELYYGVRFGYIRINFRQDADPAAALFTQVAEGGYSFTNAVVDWGRTSPKVADLRFTTSQGRLIAFTGDPGARMDPTGNFAAGDVCLAGIITSRYENNAWRRSTTRLVQTNKTVSQTAAAWESNYGVNDVVSVMELAAPQKSATEDMYLNKEPNA